MGDRLLGRGVLLVDAFADRRRMVRRRLQDEGATVAESDTGHHALALAATRRFDLALVDLRLPDMLGERLIASLAALPRHAPDITAISATAREDVALAIAAGASRVLIHPVDWDRLLRYLDTHRVNR
jgi:CheY-like chemotaxis protein